MPDISLVAEPVLGGINISIGVNSIVERNDLAIVSVAVPKNGERALSTSLKDTFSLDVPAATLSSTYGKSRAIRTAPDQLLLVFPHESSDANAVVQAKLDGTGYTTDQTDVWVALEIAGPDTIAALERICPLDLHEDVFPVNASARTIMEHMGALIIRMADDTFILLGASSSAASFLHAVETSYHNVLK